MSRMVSPKVSIVIPYFKRIKNIFQCLKSIENQNIDKSLFEVIVSSFEFNTELFGLTCALQKRINIKLLVTNEKWKVSRSRNFGIYNASGEIIVFLDADVIIPVDCLQNLIGHYAQNPESPLINGQLRNYEDKSNVENPYLEPFDFYFNNYLKHSDASEIPADYRWELDIKIPWAFCWTAFVAIPRKILVQNKLYFDESFSGWGAEDLEWCYRIFKLGNPIFYEKSLWCIHLPHPRDVAKNYREGFLNSIKFLKKHPCLDVEMVLALGDSRANKLYQDLLFDINALKKKLQLSFCVAVGEQEKEKRVIIGVLQDSSGVFMNISNSTLGQITEKYPLLGFMIPYLDNEIDSVYILDSIYEYFSENIVQFIRNEAVRISKTKNVHSIKDGVLKINQ